MGDKVKSYRQASELSCIAGAWMATIPDLKDGTSTSFLPFFE
jgi:hypothetical protein